MNGLSECCRGLKFSLNSFFVRNKHVTFTSHVKHAHTSPQCLHATIKHYNNNKFRLFRGLAHNIKKKKKKDEAYSAKQRFEPYLHRYRTQKCLARSQL